VTDHYKSKSKVYYETSGKRRIKMDKKIGYYVFGGLLIGAFLGWGWSANGNALPGIGIGALAGVALGWFIAAAILKRTTGEKANVKNE
jgi:formate hydrogenlyase subunit 4